MNLRDLRIYFLSIILIIGGQVRIARGIEYQKQLQMVAQIQPRASLSLKRTQISFAEPEDQGVILSQEGPVQLTVKVRASATKSATLSMIAESDLEGLTGSIPIQRVAWTAKGLRTAQGVLSQTNEQIVERYNTSGIHHTQMVFALKNDGKLPKGTFRSFVNFTLTIP